MWSFDCSAQSFQRNCISLISGGAAMFMCLADRARPGEDVAGTAHHRQTVSSPARPAAAATAVQEGAGEDHAGRAT